MQQAPQQPSLPPSQPDITRDVERLNGLLRQVGTADPSQVLRGARAQREELRDQLSGLEDKRRDLANEVGTSDGANRAGIERRLSEVDQRISDVEKQIAAADLQVAKAAAIPGAVVPDPPPPPERGPPEGVLALFGVFIVFVLFPLTIAQARRLWRRSAAAVSELPKVLAERLTRLDHAIDTIAIEVERISEGQRFLTKVMTDNSARALGAGPAQPIEVNVREGAPISRSSSR